MKTFNGFALVKCLMFALMLLGLMTGAMPALAETVDWQQQLPDHIPGGDAAAIAIPIIAIVMVFGAPALTVILVALFVFRHRERRQQLLNERIQTFLENGQPEAAGAGALDPGRSGGCRH